jgi:hypothetical protein
MGIGAAIGGIASVIGGRSQGKAASDAARAQTAAGRQQLDFQQDVYADQTRNFAPFLGSGQNALAAYNFEMGLGARPTFGGTPMAVESFFEGGAPGQTTGGGGFNGATLMQGLGLGARGASNALPQGQTTPGGQGVQRFRVGGQTFNTREEAEAFARQNATGGSAYGGFKATPGYDFRRQQGIDAIDASAAARGGLMSGRTLQDLTTFGDGIASQEYQNYMTRLAGMTDMGMGAAGMQATAGNNAAAGVGNALSAIGGAQAAGAIGKGNATAGMINNLAGTFGYMNKPGGGITVGSNLFGGNSWGA